MHSVRRSGAVGAGGLPSELRMNDYAICEGALCIDRRHTEDVAWVGRAMRGSAPFVVPQYGDIAVAKFAADMFIARHGGRRTTSAAERPGLARARATARA